MTTIARLRSSFGIEPLDLRAVGLFRIWIGLLLILDTLINKLPNGGWFYGPNGIFEGHYAWLDGEGYPFYLNLYHALGHDGLVTLYFVVSLVVFGLFTAGRGGRPLAIACYLLVWMPYMSNSFTLLGEDRLLLYMLFLALFLPLNERYAFRGRRPRRSDPVHPVTTLCALAFVGVIYAAAGAAKLGGSWGTGEAMRNMLAALGVQSLLTEWSLGRPGLLRAIESLGVGFELLVVPLIFFPLFNRHLRVVVILGLVGLHFGSLLVLFPGYYPFVVVTWLLLLVPRFVLDAVERRLAVRLPRLASPFGDGGGVPRPVTPVARWLGRVRRAALVGCVLVLASHHATHRKVTGIETLPPGPLATFVAKKRIVAATIITKQRGPSPLKLFYPLFSSHVYYDNEPGRHGGQKFNIVCVGELTNGDTVNLMADPDTEVMGYSFFKRRPYNYLVPVTRANPGAIVRFGIGERFVRHALARWRRRHPEHPVERATLLRVTFDPAASELTPLRTRPLASVDGS